MEELSIASLGATSVPLVTSKGYVVIRIGAMPYQLLRVRGGRTAEMSIKMSFLFAGIFIQLRATPI